MCPYFMIFFDLFTFFQKGLYLFDIHWTTATLNYFNVKNPHFSLVWDPFLSTHFFVSLEMWYVRMLLMSHG